MVQLRMIQYVQNGMDGACLEIVRTVNQPFDTGMQQRTGTHGAGFNRGKQVAFSQTVIAEDSSSLAQGEDFGVRGGVGGGDVTVPAATNDASVADHDSADRNLAGFQRALSRAESFLHPKFIGGGGRVVAGGFRRILFRFRFQRRSGNILAACHNEKRECGDRGF